MATSSRLDNFALPLSIIIASIIIGGSIVIASGNSGTRGAIAAAPQPAPTQAAAPSAAVDISKVKLSSSPSVGRADAPVVVAYWYDYKCSYCKMASEQILSKFMTDYVVPGKMRIVFKDMQFLSPDSQKIGIAGRAVWEVNKTKWPDWHKAMFDNQSTQIGSNIDDKIKTITTQVMGQAESDRVISLMSSKASTYQAAIDSDKNEGNTFGVRSTPSFIIGKQLVVGARPYPDFQAAVDLVLKK